MNRGWMFGMGVGLLALGSGAGYAVGVRSSGPAVEASESRSAPGAVVATFVGGRLTAEDVRARLRDEGPLLAEQHASKEGRRELVRSMVRDRLLLAEARKKGHHLRPAVARQCDAALLESFLSAEIDEPERQRPVTDEELRAWFSEHQQSLARPEQVRLAHIFLAAPEADAALRERQRRAAFTLLAEVRAAVAKDPYAFATLARQRSEDTRTRPLGGELPMMTEPQVLEALGARVASAIFAEARPSGVLEQLIETPEGFHVVRVLERVEAVKPSFEQLREVLAPRVARERRGARQSSLVEALERQAQVQLDEAALDALSLH